jgi:hypothetical protein
MKRMNSPRTLTLVLCSVCAVSACGSRTACEQAKSIVDSVCSGQEATCWYCDCRSKNAGVLYDADTGACGCDIPQAQALDPATQCIGAYLSGSQSCIDDEKGCRSRYQSYCENSKK